jgi:FAD/FMN-containing dehydrogenase
VHDTVEDMEILTGDGQVLVCSPDENTDLFFGFPNSYGTLGYALRLTVRLIPAARYVRLTHTRFSDPEDYFERVADACSASAADYVDGTIFGSEEMYLTQGEFIDDAPRASDYTYMRIYYQSIRRKPVDWLTTKGYIWRWDTDWFWCSKHFYVQKPAVRLFAKWALHSRTYQKLMRLSYRLLPDSGSSESVIQDVDIPVENAAKFLRFLLAEVGITPVWMCPFRSPDSGRRWDLNPLEPEKLYVNFGFWDTVPTTHEDGYYNRKVERRARELCGAKGLYSTAYYDPQTFWSIYNRTRYLQLKEEFDPQGVFPDLYAKCVQRK